MIDNTSRYAVIENAVYETDGCQITYKRRRFLPQSETIPTQYLVSVAIGDRLDSIAARTLGDPEQFWQLCDANNGMNPFELTAEAELGRQLCVPIPQFQEAL
jgi:hypothetical protein